LSRLLAIRLPTELTVFVRRNYDSCGSSQESHSRVGRWKIKCSPVHMTLEGEVTTTGAVEA